MIIPMAMQQAPQNQEFLLSNEPVERPVSTSAPSQSPQTTQGGGAPPSASTDLYAQAPQPFNTSSPTVGIGRQGPIQERLFSPLEQGVQTQRSEIAGEIGQFRQEAGPVPEIQGTRNTIRDYLNTGIGEEEARGVLNTQYTGPTELDPADLATIQERQRQLEQRRQSLMGGESLAGLVNMSSPGLTRGQQIFEAQHLMSDPGFQARRREVLPQLTKASGKLAGAQAEAADIAGERQQRAGDIRDLASGYLSQRQADNDAWINARLLQAKTQQKRVEDEYARLKEGDAASGLRALGAAPSPEMNRAAAAQQLFDSILNSERYAPIRDQGLLPYSVSGHGREAWGAPGRPDLPMFKARRQGLIDDETAQLLVARESELRDKFGYQPGQPNQAGELSDVLRITPSGEVDKYQPGNLRDFIKLKDGVSPTRENVSTQQQRDIANRISTLLGEAERMEKVEPFRAASIVADVEGFLAAEERALQERGDRLGAQQKQWADQVKRIRKRYRKATSGSLGALGGLVGSALGYTLGLGNPAAGAAGGAAGTAIGGAIE